MEFAAGTFTVAGTDAESLKLASDIASAQGDSTRAAFYRQQLGDIGDQRQIEDQQDHVADVH